MRLNASCLLSVSLVACSSGYQSQQLKVSLVPARGIKLQEEEAGPPTIARFSSGFELRSVVGSGPALDEGQLPAALDQVVAGAKLPSLGTLLSSRLGTLPIGKVARFELRGSGSRTLLYFIPLGRRFLVARLTQPEREYGLSQPQVELSLSSLRELP